MKLVAALLVGIVAAWLWQRSNEPPPALSRPMPAQPRTAAAQQVVSPIDMAKVTQLAQDPAMLPTYLKLFEEANRYPPTTLPLSAGMQDALEPERYFTTDMPAPWVRNLYTKPAYRLYYRLEAQKVRTTGRDPIKVRLTVFRGDQQRAPVAADVDPVEVQQVLPTGRLRRLGALILTSTSLGTFEASYQPPVRGGEGEEDALLQFVVAWKLADGTGKLVRDRLLVQHTAMPPATFTGRVTDVLEDGSLLVNVEIDSNREGQAHVSAHLFGADGTSPIATAIARPTLPRGRTWVPLQFYGLAIRDRGIAGPYVVKTLRGYFPSTTSAGRGGEMEAFSGGHRTQSYSLDSFTRKEWDSPEKRLGIAAYQAELEQLLDREEAEDQ